MDIKSILCRLDAADNSFTLRLDDLARCELRVPGIQPQNLVLRRILISEQVEIVIVDHDVGDPVIKVSDLYPCTVGFTQRVERLNVVGTVGRDSAVENSDCPF